MIYHTKATSVGLFLLRREDINRYRARATSRLFSLHWHNPLIINERPVVL